jgi:uncharacterized membrane protein YedE/YeeE
MTLNELFPNGYAHYLAGGALIGLGTALLFVGAGLIGGMSTVFSSVWSWFSRAPHFHQERIAGSRVWRLVYAGGLIAGALLWLFSVGSTWQTGVGAWQLLIGGFIAGFGARLSNGCTSGHGICGLASLQLPSALAVLIFLATAIATAHLVRALGGV